MTLKPLVVASGYLHVCKNSNVDITNIGTMEETR